MSNSGGWTESAAAWIAQQGEQGDRGRRYVLDPAMLAQVDAGRADASPFQNALDVGCGEGRFCRLLQQRGITATGIDPTEAFIQQAQRLDSHGDYRIARAEALPFDAASFDLVISCLTLCDIEDFTTAIAEMARVLAPGGSLLVANLTAHQSAGMRGGWQFDEQGNAQHFAIDDYSDEWAEWQEWAGIRVLNWHRPLRSYMQAFLRQGLHLQWFDEPPPIDGYEDLQGQNHRAPWFNLMRWDQPK